MSANPNHHVCVHGHFYQPPRENPWLGVIEPQESALPFHDWNERIASECYTALTCSPVCGPDHLTRDLFNCYAHLSFNFGPTLGEWMERHIPAVFSRVRVADELARQSYSGHGGAIAQAYNHMILPLADARDRHTQIVWGLREFECRYNRRPDSLWLAETAIDMNTVRALIDHGIKYVILSPLQASYVRRFGEKEWTGVPDGTIESRHPYRLFEVDGAGRTHFDRFLDIFFYDKTLSTKVSFEHLLTDAQKLEWFLRQRLDDDATLPQLVLIATDGEIYGHHEKHGNRALAYFFHKLLDRKNILLTNLSLYLAENPPCWEVRLWDGVDGKGSSWSCSHGVGRWERDCGCSGGPHDWNQKWRTPLRQAFDGLRDAVREVFRREVGALVNDAFEARNDYISVILNPSAANRAAFLRRHAQKQDLSAQEAGTLWRLLEMDRNAMLMYTSCGWFFSELSGIEPVQNMRYALRAAELAAPFAPTDLVEQLRTRLARAESNVKEQGTGRDIFDRHVLTTRYGAVEVATVHILCRLLALPEPAYALSCQIEAETGKNTGEVALLWGRALCRDARTLQEQTLYFVAARGEGARIAAAFFPTSAEARAVADLRTEEVFAVLEREGVALERLPYADRLRIFHQLKRGALSAADAELHGVYRKFELELTELTRHRLPLPQSLRMIGEQALRSRLQTALTQLAQELLVSEDILVQLRGIFAEAARCGLTVDRSEGARILARTLAEKLEDLMADLNERGAREMLQMLRLAREFGLEPDNPDLLQDRFWRILHLTPRPTPKTRSIVDTMRELGAELGFDTDLLRSKTQALFSTPV